MCANPEIQKSLWINFSLHRILLAPVFIGLAAYLATLLFGPENAGKLGYVLALFFLFLVGIKHASESVLDEVNEATWDFQRQSAISPFAMAFGKLFGSTLYSWYVAAIGLALLVLFGTPLEGIPLRNNAFVLIIGALAGQATALLLSLLSIPTIHSDKAHKPFRYFMMGILIGWLFTWLANSALSYEGQSLEWYHLTFPKNYFHWISLGIFLGWIYLGLVRLFSRELQYPQLPWAWTAFSVFCILYFPGLINIDLSHYVSAKSEMQIAPEMSDLINVADHIPYYTAFSVSILLTYIAVLADHINTVRYFKIQTRLLAHENVLSLLRQIPWWPISFALTVITAVVVCIAQPATPAISSEFSLITSIAIALGFLIRDILIIHFCIFALKPKNALLNMLIYFVILYILVPGILSALHLTSLSAAFRPSLGEHALAASLGLLVQIAIAGALCFKRWKDATRLISQ